MTSQTAPKGAALVVGAARGIGAATATRLGAEGFSVTCADICSGRDEPALDYPLAVQEDLDGVVESLRRVGVDASAVRLDVRDRVAVQEVVDGIEDLSTVVVAAGVVWGGAPLWEMPRDAWQTVLDVNVTGTYHVIAAAVPRLLGRSDPSTGRVVAVASAGADRALPQMAAYSASKHAVVGIVRSVAAELGPTGVTVNAVAPGSTRTAILDASAAAYGLADVDEFASHHLIGRLLDPDEVADAIAWLCSPSAGSVTGSLLAVDGGMSVR